MIPPTPTPFIPDPNAVIINMPNISLWDSAPLAVGFWNSFPTATTLFQALIIIGIASVFVTAFIRIANRVASDNSNNVT